MKIRVIFGNIEFITDMNGENTARVHNIYQEIYCESKEEAEEAGESYISKGIYSAYLIPEYFNGNIIFNPTKKHVI